jgi:hypothetical protein
MRHPATDTSANGTREEQTMPDSFEVSRFVIALFISGIFWMMVLFFAERAWLRSRLPGALLMAMLVLALSAWALFRVVVDDRPWKMTASQADVDR